MNDTIGEALDEAAQYSPTSSQRRRLIVGVLEESGITNMGQLAVLVEGLALVASEETGQGGNDEIAEGIFANAQTIADALRSLHEMIQSVA